MTKGDNSDNDVQFWKVIIVIINDVQFWKVMIVIINDVQFWKVVSCIFVVM